MEFGLTQVIPFFMQNWLSPKAMTFGPKQKGH
jgi:hypothetical protein